MSVPNDSSWALHAIEQAVRAKPREAWLSSFYFAKKRGLGGPLSLVRQQTLDVALNILQGPPVISALAANQDLARRMLKHIMLALSVQGEAILFGERK